MPKKIITDETLPLALGLLHSWRGKLTWDLYTEKLARRLKVDRIAKRSLYKHDEIVEVYHQVQARLRAQTSETQTGSDPTVDLLQREITKLRSELAHYKQQVENLQHAILRLQRNTYLVSGLDQEALRDLLTRPLPERTD